LERRNHAKGVALLHFVGVGLTDTETRFLMKEVLRLPLSYFAAVQKVVGEGRWRTAKDPVAYVRTAAWRTGIADAEWDRPKGLPVPNNTNHDEFVDCRTTGQVDAIKVQGIWRHSNSDVYDPDDYDVDGFHITPGERLRNRVPDRFCTLWPSPEERLELERDWLLPFDPIRVPDWDAIAKAAGLDAEEAEVLHCKARGWSRDRSLALCKRDSERKRMQAAWRRFDRNGCLERVEAVLRGSQ
jgi:hypothetical protein